MGKLKKWVRTGLQAFAPTGVLLGAIIALIGGYQSMTGTTLSSLAAVQTISLSAVILIVCGAIVILRHEYLMRELDSYIGNDHARRLWADGIPPLREEYLRYVRRGDFGIVNRFWSAGTVNVEGDGGVSDLHIACEIGNVAIVQGLLERGARPGRSSNAGITPLMYAAIDGHHRVAEVLLQHNCAINATSTDAGCSALYVAAAHGHLPFVELLIREGANKDSVDHDNMTPLMAALAQGHWAVACNLLAAGANPNRIDGSGATIMDYALLKDAPDDIVRKLKDYGIKASKPEIISRGGGFARTGKVRVHWRHKSEEA